MKVIRHYKTVRLIGDDQIPAMPRVAAGEQEMGIGDNHIPPM